MWKTPSIAYTKKGYLQSLYTGFSIQVKVNPENNTQIYLY